MPLVRSTVVYKSFLTKFNGTVEEQLGGKQHAYYQCLCILSFTCRQLRAYSIIKFGFGFT